LVADTVARGLWGLENLSAIPGSVGATPVQNVGAYGVEVSSFITTVEVFDCETLTQTHLAPDVCAFAYRDSLFKHPEGQRYVVTAVTYRLAQEPALQLSYVDLAARFKDAAAPALPDIRAAVIEIRARKFPDLRTIGTAGSFFKNPVIPKAHYERLQAQYPALPGFSLPDGNVKIALGWILDHALHLKGACAGDVCTYANQALVIINKGNASASAVDAFARMIEQNVHDATDIAVEREVRTLP
jgi:UDP-N-acetylmuramate dehydrogenase